MLVVAPAVPDAPKDDELREALVDLGNLGLSDRDVLQVQVADPMHPTPIGSTIPGVTHPVFPTLIGYSSHALAYF